MEMLALIDKIEDWGIDRGLDKADSLMQTTKTLEEVIELQQALINKDQDEIEDAIGDIFVTLVMVCLQNNVAIEDCIAGAYQVIKDRKGKLVDGLWVKE